MKNSRKKNWKDIFKTDIWLIVGSVPSTSISNNSDATSPIQMVSVFNENAR